MQLVRRESLVEELCTGLQAEAHAVPQRYLVCEVFDMLVRGLDPLALASPLRLLNPLAP